MTTLSTLLRVFNASLKKALFETVSVLFKEGITSEREVKLKDTSSVRVGIRSVSQ